jgi:putative transposase
MRKLRLLVDGAPYHVISRTNRKEFLLESPLAKNLLLETLRQAKRKYEFQIDNFVIMDNHIHLLLWPPLSIGLPILMKWILGVYATRYNRAFTSCGHVWADRYFSHPIASLSEYRVIFSYIDANPVNAMLVTNPAEWEWSGFYHNLSGRHDIIGV